MSTIRPWSALTLPEIREAARQQADAGEPMAHGFVPGTSQAISYELAYAERAASLQSLEASE